MLEYQRCELGPSFVLTHSDHDRAPHLVERNLLLNKSNLEILSENSLPAILTTEPGKAGSLIDRGRDFGGGRLNTMLSKYYFQIRFSDPACSARVPATLTPLANPFLLQRVNIIWGITSALDRLPARFPLEPNNTLVGMPGRNLQPPSGLV